MLQYSEYARQIAPATDPDTMARRAKLYSKINKVIVAMRRVAKNGYNSFHKYSYATESDLVDAIRDQLESVALAFLPPVVLGYEMVERPKKQGGSDWVARVTIQYSIADCETGEVQSTVLVAEGSDSLDKAFYKAYSGGTKYFLMKSFLVATGDDPEQDAPEPPARYAPPPAEVSPERAALLATLKASWPADRPRMAAKDVFAMSDHQIEALINELTGGN